MPPSATPPPRRVRPGIAALTACVVAAAGVGPAAAQAPPRAVAVIDATAGPVSDAEVTALAARLDAQLDREDALVPVASDRRPALVGAVPDEARAALVEARGALGRGRGALARFAHKDAVAEAERGLRRIVEVAPDGEIVGLLADLAFLRGLAHHGEGDGRGARRDFALVHRLAPGRTLDPVAYLPEVIEAFDAARRAAGTATLDVEAPDGAVVWVDGARVGTAPAAVRLPAGLHAVTVTGDALVTRGHLVEVDAAGARLRVEATEVTATLMIQRRRRALATAADDAARADEVARLVRLVGGQDAIVVGRDASGALVTWIYSGRTGALGEPRPARGADAPDIVKPLRPIVVRPPPGGGGGPELPPPPPEPPWWERRWVQATIGGGIAAGVLTTFVILARRPIGESPLIGRPTIR